MGVTGVILLSGRFHRNEKHPPGQEPLRRPF